VVVARKPGDAPAAASTQGGSGAPRPQGSGGYQGAKRGGSSAPAQREDDGMTYNPFAALLKGKK